MAAAFLFVPKPGRAFFGVIEAEITTDPTTFRACGTDDFGFGFYDYLIT
jgi:hypothetical protein